MRGENGSGRRLSLAEEEEFRREGESGYGQVELDGSCLPLPT